MARTDSDVWGRGLGHLNVDSHLVQYVELASHVRGRDHENGREGDHGHVNVMTG